MTTNYVGANLDLNNTKLLNVADATDADDAAAFGQTCDLIQQNGTATGRRIFVQFTGDSDPGAPVKGDVRFLET